jgi:hypothetical protein
MMIVPCLIQPADNLVRGRSFERLGTPVEKPANGMVMASRTRAFPGARGLVSAETEA